MLPDAPEKHPAYFFILELRTFLIHSAFEKSAFRNGSALLIIVSPDGFTSSRIIPISSFLQSRSFLSIAASIAAMTAGSMFVNLMPYRYLPVWAGSGRPV